MGGLLVLLAVYAEIEKAPLMWRHPNNLTFSLLR